MAASAPQEIADRFIEDRSPAAIDKAMAALGARPEAPAGTETGAWSVGAVRSRISDFAEALAGRLAGGSAGPVIHADAKEIAFLASPEADPERAAAHHVPILEARSTNRDLAFETVLEIGDARVGQRRGLGVVDVKTPEHPVLVVTYGHVAPLSGAGTNSRVASNATLSVEGDAAALAEGRYGIRAMQLGADGKARPLRTTRADEAAALRLASETMGLHLLSLEDSLEGADAELRRVRGRPAGDYPTRRADTIAYPASPAELAKSAGSVRAKPPFHDRTGPDLATTFHEAARLDCRKADGGTTTLRGLPAIERAAAAGAELAMDRAMMGMVKARIVGARLRQRALAPDALDRIIAAAGTGPLKILVTRRELEEVLSPPQRTKVAMAVAMHEDCARFNVPGTPKAKGRDAFETLSKGFGRGKYRSIELDAAALRERSGAAPRDSRALLLAAFHASAEREREMRSRTPPTGRPGPAKEGPGL